MVTLSTSSFASVMQRNVNSVILISEKERARIVSYLFKVKLQAVTVQLLAALLKTYFSYGLNRCLLELL